MRPLVVVARVTGAPQFSQLGVCWSERSIRNLPFRVFRSARRLGMVRRALVFDRQTVGVPIQFKMVQTAAPAVESVKTYSFAVLMRSHSEPTAKPLLASSVTTGAVSLLQT